MKFSQKMYILYIFLLLIRSEKKKFLVIGLGQNQFCPLWGPKILKNGFRNFFLESVLWSTIKESFFKFLKIPFPFYVFSKMKTLPCAHTNLPTFWNGTPKNMPDRKHYIHFRKSQKLLNHSTLMKECRSFWHRRLKVVEGGFRLVE